MGAALFHRQFTPEQGLGPLFNQDRCSSCHDLPVLGGTGAETVVKATRWTPDGRCDLLPDAGGDNVQSHATPALAALGVEREMLPSGATGHARLVSPALFGLGLVDAIPEQTLLARHDPDDRDGDGISGRAGRTADGRLGRFGQKADVATLVDFVAVALGTEMGLTTPNRPAEETVNGRPVPAEADPAADPEIHADTLQLLADFVRFLAAVRPELPTSRAARDSVRRGERLFRELGCEACHVPALRTGRHASRTLDRQRVPLYSDLLLHDLGPELADICAPGAAPAEIRTARLAGLRYRITLLHDGRAQRLEDAIMMHGGEAERARNAFARLAPRERAYLLRFLSSL